MSVMTDENEMIPESQLLIKRLQNELAQMTSERDELKSNKALWVAQNEDNYNDNVQLQATNDKQFRKIVTLESELATAREEIAERKGFNRQITLENLAFCETVQRQAELLAHKDMCFDTLNERVEEDSKTISSQAEEIANIRKEKALMKERATEVKDRYKNGMGDAREEVKLLQAKLQSCNEHLAQSRRSDAFRLDIIKDLSIQIESDRLQLSHYESATSVEGYAGIRKIELEKNLPDVLQCKRVKVIVLTN